MNEVKELLNTEIQSELEGLENIELGSDQYKIAVDGVTKLMDKAIELKKVDLESEEKKLNREFNERKFNREMDEKVKERKLNESKLNVDEYQRNSDRAVDRELRIQQMKDTKKDQICRNIITVASIVVPAGLTIWGTVKSLRFEQDGTVTTIVGKGFINKLLPKK